MEKIVFSNINVLIGKNNEGKSNILRGINVALTALIRHGTKKRPRNLIPRRNDESIFVWKRDFPIEK